MALLSNIKFNRIFNLERGHKGQFAWKQKNTKNGSHFGIRCMGSETKSGVETCTVACFCSVRIFILEQGGIFGKLYTRSLL